MIVYIATNMVTGRIYIGKTVRNLSHAKARHKSRAFKYNYTTYFYNALRKYGWDKFEWYIIYSGVSDEDIKEKEREVINNCKPWCYNMTDGGDGSAGIIVSEETREKLRQNMLGDSNRCFGLFGKDHPAYGNKHSEEFKQQMSERMSGRILSQNTKDKISEKHKTYTDEQLKSITKLRDENKLTFREIAKELGFLYASTVYRIYKRHK